MLCWKLAYFTSSIDFDLQLALTSADTESTLGVHLRVIYSLLFQASEEEEIVDLMLMKLFSFFGIKCKKEEKPVTGEQLQQPASEWMKTLKSHFACWQSIYVFAISCSG